MSILYLQVFYTAFSGILINYVVESINVSTLRFVHSIYRHGDRNPDSGIPSDVKNDESTWDQGYGELTNIGIQQHYKLGKFIKNRYRGFLTESYNSKEIYVRSTSYNRTIMSAMANFAGMYPPDLKNSWNDEIMWQPIPVHSRPKEEDPMLSFENKCPTVDDIYKREILVSKEYMKLENDNADFLADIYRKAGYVNLTLWDIGDLFYALYCEDHHKDTHKKPVWVTQKIYDRIVTLFVSMMEFRYNHPIIQRLRGGMLFHEIAQRMKEKVDNATFMRNLKSYAYSCHDDNQMGLLNNFEAFDGSFPVYAQLLLIELHEKSGQYIVELYKKNDTNGEEILPIPLTACGQPCKLENFHRMSLSKKPTDWEEECGLKKKDI